MASGFLLALREGLEAALIVGVVISYLGRIGANDQKAPVWRGVIAAILVSLAAGFALFSLGFRLEGFAEELFEGITLLVAAAILTYVIFWLSTSNPAARVSADTEIALSKKKPAALFWLAFFAVVREGIELALFLLAAGVSSGSRIIFGAMLGLAAAVVLGWLIYTGFRKLNLRLFFQVMNILLILFAAGLIGYGVHELNEAGIIPNIIDEVWNINYLINDKSELGLFLKALFGYNGNPSLSEALSYGTYIVFIGYLTLKKPLSKPKK